MYTGLLTLFMDIPLDLVTEQATEVADFISALSWCNIMHIVAYVCFSINTHNAVIDCVRGLDVCKILSINDQAKIIIVFLILCWYL